MVSAKKALFTSVASGAVVGVADVLIHQWLENTPTTQPLIVSGVLVAAVVAGLGYWGMTRR